MELISNQTGNKRARKSSLLFAIAGRFEQLIGRFFRQSLLVAAIHDRRESADTVSANENQQQLQFSSGNSVKFSA